MKIVVTSFGVDGKLRLLFFIRLMRSCWETDTAVVLWAPYSWLTRAMYSSAQDEPPVEHHGH